jgi:hypothetical protein
MRKYRNSYNPSDAILFIQSAFKHGCSQSDIEHAIKTKVYEGLLRDEDDIFAIIGFNTVANPIEVFYNEVDDRRIKVFHAMPLREKVALQMS